MINCLVDYIGLRNVQDSPTSNLYVNDLHGITTEQFDVSLEAGESGDIVETWTVLESRAISLFEMDLMSNLKKYFNNYQIIGSGLTGYVDDNTLADHGSGKYAGWLFDLSAYSSSQKIEINDIRIHLASAVNFNVKIFDANTGEELYTKAVTGAIGAQVVKILKSYNVYEHNKIFVCYDTVIPYRISNDPTTVGIISEGNISTSSTVLASNIDASESGLSIAYNVKCGIDEFVCSRLTLFLEPYLYKLGIEFLKTSKYSKNINRYTLLDTETTTELISEYELEYQRMIDSVFEDLKVPDDGICFICSKAITKKILIP